MNYGLPDTTVEKINAVFESFPEVKQAVLYGSRAKGNYKPGSDIDLTLHGSALTTFLFNEIVSKLDDLLLPYKIDLSILRRSNTLSWRRISNGWGLCCISAVMR